MPYLWLKAAHVVAVIAWMAAMLYMPRLFVYHSGVDPRSETSRIFKIMEGRLLRMIMTPAMILVWITGIWLAVWSGFYKAGWLHAKIALVLVLSGLHGFFSQRVRKFSKDQNQSSAKFYRIINEVPTIALIGIVILVVVKPF
jgi:protoporphyrinogen IX oxidase